MIGPKGKDFSTYLLYGDDIFVFIFSYDWS